MSQLTTGSSAPVNQRSQRLVGSKSHGWKNMMKNMVEIKLGSLLTVKKQKDQFNFGNWIFFTNKQWQLSHPYVGHVGIPLNTT